MKKAGISQPHHRDAEENNQDCSKCHSRTYCWGCHVTQKPHDKSGFDHAKESKTKSRLCAQCHDFNFCTDCHKIKKAHTPKNYKDKTHGMFGASVASCEGSACHTQQFCNKCHVKLGTP